MLRLAFACLAGVAVLFVGVSLFGGEQDLETLAIGLLAMFVTACLAPRVFFYGEPVRKRSREPRG